MTGIIGFHNKGRYTDIRILVREVMTQNPECKKGILILFDPDGAMLVTHVATSSFLAFAGADLLHKSVVLNEDDS